MADDGSGGCAGGPGEPGYVVACHLAGDYLQLMFHRYLPNYVAHTYRHYPVSTGFLYLGIHTRCTFRSPFVCAPTL